MRSVILKSMNLWEAPLGAPKQLSKAAGARARVAGSARGTPELGGPAGGSRSSSPPPHAAPPCARPAPGSGREHPARAIPREPPGRRAARRYAGACRQGK